MSRAFDFYKEQQLEPGLKVVNECRALRGPRERPLFPEPDNKAENEKREDAALEAYFASGDPKDYFKTMSDKDFLIQHREMESMDEQNDEQWQK